MDPNQLRSVTIDQDGHKVVQLATGRIAVPFDPLYEAERAAAAAAAATDPPDELRCRYKSTRCLRPRAKKRNGELHNFCQMHRERANQNQRNSELRKRSTKSRPRGRLGSQSQMVEDNQTDEDTITTFSYLAPGTPHFNLPEPLQDSDSPHPGPTYDELKETAMLLSFPDRDRE